MKTMIAKYAVMISLLLITGCPPAPVPPSPDGDAGTEDRYDASTPATCVNWCKHALELKCSSAQPTRGGSSCTDVCTNVQSGPMRWNLRCRISAKSCAEADACAPVQ